MRRLIVVAALALCSCAALFPPPGPKVIKKPSSAAIDPGARDKAFSRALASVQARGWMVAVSDRAGGLLTTQTMGTGMKDCGQLSCDSRSTLQISISEMGTVTVNLHREFFLNAGGVQRWFVPTLEENVRPIEEEQTAILADIVGPQAPPAK